MLDKIETIRQVLANAVEQGIPGALTAMNELTHINHAVLAIKELEGAINQAVIDEAEDNA